ncbi:MAG: threonine--tRNA ligase [Candidatus Levybacteria bacterium]|nr:threonine--tRNA ligase [Candidatus Levybacteria bacterium]
MSDTKQIKDHKQIGQELELFFTNDIAPGAPFWMPKGMVIFKELEKYIRELLDENGYVEISTPIMVKSDLFKQSGHWDKFGVNNMYNLMLDDEEEGSTDQYTLKPMNCPESTVFFRFRPRSYRELPMRLSEIGRLHRREKSGEVNGLLRVRQLTMDDAHLYITEDQIFSEVGNILDMMIEFYTKFGFDPEFKLATRPEKFAGTKKNWEVAEKDLEEVLKKKNLKYQMKPQDGAFYGPKIDVHIKDSLGREWQLATVQLDFWLSDAFDLKYVDKDGKEKKPVVIHRAILGSFERFIGILTEHYQGAFPLWLSPIQSIILPIADRHLEAALKVSEELKKRGVRVSVDDRSETLQAKIRDATLQKIPYICIIGDKEIESNSISVRTRDGKDLGVMGLSQFLEKVTEQIGSKK